MVEAHLHFSTTVSLQSISFCEYAFQQAYYLDTSFDSECGFRDFHARQLLFERFFFFS